MRRIGVILALLGLLISTPAWGATIRATLTWTDVAGEDGYRIERRVDPGTYATVGTIGAGVVTFADSGLSPGIAYCYRVLAFNVLGDGLPSNEACAATPPTPPPVGGLQVIITVVP